PAAELAPPIELHRADPDSLPTPPNGALAPPVELRPVEPVERAVPPPMELGRDEPGPGLPPPVELRPLGDQVAEPNPVPPPLDPSEQTAVFAQERMPAEPAPADK